MTVEHLNNDPTLPRAIVVDIDGTLAHRQDRNPYHVGPKLEDDVPDRAVIACVRAMQQAGFHIVIVSGRVEATRSFTQRWLARYDIPYDALFFRADDDARPDWQIKHDIYANEILPKFYVEFVLDDRNQVVDHLRECGIKVFQVQPGDF